MKKQRKNPPKNFKKLASSPTLEGIQKFISRYYCEKKQIREMETGFSIHNWDGRKLDDEILQTSKGFYFGYYEN